MHFTSITVEPSGPHTHTVVFLHGRGNNTPLGEAFPSYRWVFPQAKLSNPVTFLGEKVSQWFDIWNVSDFTDHEELQAEGLRKSVAGVREIITQEAEALGGRYDRIILAGISQGAATGVHTLLNLKLPDEQDRLGAFLGFSCRMPFPGRSLAKTRAILGLRDVPEGDGLMRHTPVLLEHCIDDPLVLVEWKEYQDGGHWFNSPTGLDDVVKFLNTLGLTGNEAAHVGATAGAMDLS